MIRHYLTVAVRSLIARRAYALINIFGLALGLAACLMIFLYVRYESSYDQWLPEAERIHQVQATWSEPGQPVSRSQHSPFPVREALPAGFPDIEAISVLTPGKTVTMRGGEPVFIDAATVDPAFFDIFQLPFADGSAKTALPDTRSVVLTETEALKQLGTTKAVGKTFTLGAGGGKQDYRVTGVLRDLPKNTSLRLGIIFRNDPASFASWAPSDLGWGNMNQQHYLKLKAGADAERINAALPAWEKKTIAPQLIGGQTSSQADIMSLKLVPIADIHLGPAQGQALTPGGDPQALATFGVVAMLILGMAIMNFVNLTTARATQRAREVALRKVLGARRGQIAVQLFGETMLMVAAAMLIALAAVELAAPFVGGRIDADLSFAYFGKGGILLPALVLIVVTGLLGGLYPALSLSRFQPAAVLRANKGSAEAPGSARLRAALVVLQFAIAIGLIVCTSLIWRQTRYVETVDPGYRRDGLIQIDSAWRFAGDSTEYEAARREMLKIPGVVGVGRTSLGLAAENKSNLAVRAEGAPADLSLGVYAIDAEFLRTMDLRLLAGRFLGERFARDRLVRPEEPSPEARAELAARGLNIVVNRHAARLLGYGDPASAVGRELQVGMDAQDLIPATIVGVVEDTRIRTARDAIEPILYSYDPDRTYQVVVRYAAARPSEVMQGLNRVWRKFEPEIPFDAAFAEDIVAELYEAERGRAALFAGFSGLAVLIACLGLYSLASFATERRTKEIGIRKVLGARVRDIVRLLAWQFSKPVVIANLVAWPVAWWAMRDWLNGFDLRIPLTAGPFLLAGLIALGIAIFTVSGHALRVARMSPIHALRYE